MAFLSLCNGKSQRHVIESAEFDKIIEKIEVSRHESESLRDELSRMRQTLVAKEKMIEHMQELLIEERENHEEAFSKQTKFLQRELMDREEKIDFLSERIRLHCSEVQNVRMEKSVYFTQLCATKKKLKDSALDHKKTSLRLQHECEKREKLEKQLNVGMTSCADKEILTPKVLKLSARNSRNLRQFKTRLANIKAREDCPSISEEDTEDDDVELW